MNFFNRKVSTLAGILILLVITWVVGYFFIHQLKEIQNIKIEAIERASGIKL